MSHLKTPLANAVRYADYRGVSTNIIFTNIRMEQLFSHEVAKRHDQELMDFLLDAVPVYAKSVFADTSQSQDEFIDEFLEKFPSAETTHRTSSQTNRGGHDVTPFGCHACHHPNVCVDTELACLVCRGCGQQGPIGFEHGYERHSDMLISRPYQYRPESYLKKHLHRLQAFDGPPISNAMEETLMEGFQSRDIQRHDITPSNMLEVLRDLKKSTWYQHRWYLTRRMNVSYTPLTIPGDIEEKICAIFKSSYQRFVLRTCAEGRGRRKFVSYLVFIQHILKHLHVSNVDEHFTPPKTDKARMAQLARMRAIMNDLCVPRHV